MKRLVAGLWIGCCGFLPSLAQISSPGLGKANTASWMAFALRQNLDSAGIKQSVTYAGIGTISDPDNYNPYTKNSIYVINEEFYHKLGKNWQYSVALSYRRQKDYEETAPFYETKVGPKQEIRFYGRLSYTVKYNKVKWVNTFRQELRTFYTPQFGEWEEPIELRTRFRSQLTAPVSPKHRIVTSLEVLWAIHKERNPENKWSAYGYKESRFCLYLSTTLSKLPFVANLGYMNNLIGYEKPVDVHYLMMDVIWENPFGRLQFKKKKPQEFLE